MNFVTDPKLTDHELDGIIEEIDEDGSGELEFAEFIQLAAKFLIEEDEEEMKWELREAFRLYDKQGKLFFCCRNISYCNVAFFFPPAIYRVK